ncbi:MAG: hypothetical protein JRE73_16635, partial [Deltaproteobacteria bacterium]|nr:hypothetical protein [Deltaproteobacteria bacterium]
MAAVTTVEDERSPYFAAVPPLAWMAAFAALADLLINRVAIPLGVDAWSSGALARVDGAGGFARNLSVISALVALSFCLASISSPKSGLPFSARAGVASFGWVLIPIVTMMTFLPRAMTRVELVLALAGLAHALILLLILAGIHLRPTRAASAALVLTLVATFSGILSLMVSLVGERTYWEHAERLSNAFRWSGELAYLAIPLAIGFAIAIPWRDARGKATLLVAGLAAGLVTGGMASWKHAVGRGRRTGAAGPSLRRGATRLLAGQGSHPLRHPTQRWLGGHDRRRAVQRSRSTANGRGPAVAPQRRLHPTLPEHADRDGSWGGLTLPSRDRIGAAPPRTLTLALALSKNYPSFDRASPMRLRPSRIMSFDAAYE